MKENDNKNRNRITEITNFYEKQLAEQKKNNDENVQSLIKYYDADIESLKEVIAAKQAEIERLLNLNK